MPLFGSRPAFFFRSRHRRHVDPWTLVTLGVALSVALPVITVLVHVLIPSRAIWAHLADTVLTGYLTNTLWLALGVGIGTTVIGTGTAWLIAMCRFPGRRVFEWALLLPLAVPTYVIAYAYTDFLQYAGPLQGELRALFGWGHGDYVFPNIRSLGGATLLITLVLYPYVYLLTRAAFLEQSACVLDVGRTLGRGPWRLFTTVAVPLARPAIIGGVSLVLMETLNEFGAVQYFGVDTFTTGIYRTWFGMGEPVAAAQLAACLLAFVIIVVALERLSRGRRRYFHTTGRYRQLPEFTLRGWHAWGACLACALPIGIGFVLPGVILADLALETGDDVLGARFLDYAGNSLMLAALAALVAVGLALVLSYGVRLHPGRTTRTATRIAAMGYAVPGSVVAVGILIPLTWVDRHLYAWLNGQLGIETGLILSGTAFVLIYAYVVRFLAVSFNTVEASLAKVTPGMDAASRTLGQTAGGTLRRVHTPLMRGSLWAALLLVFVDVMKELPATVILRPFDFDTLAVRAHNLAADERLAEAASSSLAIVLVGVIPVILLSRAIRHARPGASGGKREAL
ncbi:MULTISPECIES: ABC transporter permease [Chromohalobacter]|uniref:Binding-protein-dependent transport systems inner membrane component n=1 Tax=Chromohalobacter israelensis (strain ATCC BAA-138 / DSM 3043 / CIP 106854 / NCIMB 13768 / 1H11) TaxID=290398 RepID=Q1R045_CHRI1|nr:MULTISPECIES: iron ABC transporter permease [Chromohalobacter]ABE57913.1 binding-protein-dependent transport systems inner membrane component [Chromohalobacter salexigens DSM 3043]MDF9433787.1 iron ABC transporter permease [Chromohalobacter israelensis]MDO0946917.1 iron ABC transporter permease [Chromohalobacter salexigens]